MASHVSASGSLLPSADWPDHSFVNGDADHSTLEREVVGKCSPCSLVCLEHGDPCRADHHVGQRGGPGVRIVFACDRIAQVGIRWDGCLVLLAFEYRQDTV